MLVFYVQLFSELQWYWWHFNASDYNAHDEDVDAVFLFEGKAFDDITAHVDEMVNTYSEGGGEFKCNPGSVSVWIPKK